MTGKIGKSCTMKPKMKKKVFFILSHLRAGGSERVFWLLSQYFDQSSFDVSLVLLDSRNPFFSMNIKGVNVIHLNSIKATNSVLKLYKLIKTEKPDAIFTTSGHINTLLAGVSLFINIPKLIGRESNVMTIMTKLGGFKDRFWDLFVAFTYKQLDVAVCQSLEIKHSLLSHYKVDMKKLVIIPNPVIPTSIYPNIKNSNEKKLILIARLAVEKGIIRLLKIVSELPEEYTLTIIGDGPLKASILKEIKLLKIDHRVKLLGIVSNVLEMISEHHVLVLPSITEGFPNAVLESLSVGVPVVAFKVGGIQTALEEGFNGYIIEQDDIQDFSNKVKMACTRDWNHHAIKENANNRFSIHKVVKQYQDLLTY